MSWEDFLLVLVHGYKSYNHIACQALPATKPTITRCTFPEMVYMLDRYQCRRNYLHCQ